MSKAPKPPEIVAFLKDHHDKSKELFHAHIAEVYVIRRVLQELKTQLGEEGLKHWLASNGNPVSWADAKFILSRPEQAGINGERLADIFKN